MQRDIRKQEPYFSDLITYQRHAAHDVQSDIDGGEYTPYGNMMGAFDIFSKNLHQLVMRYSRGDEIPELSEQMSHLLNARQQARELGEKLSSDESEARTLWEDISEDSYVDYLWWLAFAVALGADDDYIRQTLQLINHAGQDRLLDRIAVALGDTGRPVASGVLYQQYAPLLEAIDSPENKRAAAVKKFLDGWYKGSRNVYWHGNDKDDDSGYMGYWAFEAALVVILFDIDDASFRDNVYYPKDLVTHTRARKEQTQKPSAPSIAPARVPAGQPCPRPGYWFTPARADSRRRFRSGDVFPDIPGTSYGAVLWQWAPDQED